MLDAWLHVNSEFIEQKTLKKLEKTINVRMLDLMDTARDAK